MPSMIDVQCTKCQKRFGWSGKFSDRPPCPKCGWRPPLAELEEVDRRMDADLATLAALAKDADGNTMQQARVLAGLTLRQAAKLLDIHPSILSDYENGRAKAPDEIVEKMGCWLHPRLKLGERL